MRAPPVVDEFGPGSDDDSEEESGLTRNTPSTVPERTDSAYY